MDTNEPPVSLVGDVVENHVRRRLANSTHQNHPAASKKAISVRYPHLTNNLQADADGCIIYNSSQTPSIGLYTNAKVSTQKLLISYTINNSFVRICYYSGSIKRPNNINSKPEQSNCRIFNIWSQVKASQLIYRIISHRSRSLIQLMSPI